MPSGDKYDARGFAIGLPIFLAIGIGFGIFGHGGIAAWGSGLALDAGTMNVTSAAMRRIAGVPSHNIWRRKPRD